MARVLSCNDIYPKKTKEVSQLYPEIQTVQLYQHRDGCKEILTVSRTHQPGPWASISALYYVRLCENTLAATAWWKRNEQLNMITHTNKNSAKWGNKVSQISTVLENECFSSALTHEWSWLSWNLYSLHKPTAELQPLPPPFPPLKQNREYKLTVHDTPNLSHI